MPRSNLSLGSTGRDPPELSPRPKPEDFSIKAISREVRKATLQHEAFVLPAALSLVSFGWCLIITPSIWALMSFLLFGGIAAATWWYRTVKGSDHLIAVRMQQLKNLREVHDKREIEELVTECHLDHYRDGEKRVHKLHEAWLQLRDLLEERLVHGDDYVLKRFLDLATKTYCEGLTTLKNVLELRRGIERAEPSERKAELRRLKAERKQLDEASPMLRSLDDRIARLKDFVQNLESREQFLPEIEARVFELEAALRNAHLQVVDQGIDEMRTILEGGDIGKQLTLVVEAARKAAEEIRGIGANHDQERLDEEARKAARES